jgi:hypothetical protein
MKLSEKIKQLDLEKQELEQRIKEIENSNTCTFKTNTAFLQNSGVAGIFKDFNNFGEWVEDKHEKHWKNLNSSTVEVTFKVLSIEEDRGQK